MASTPPPGGPASAAGSSIKVFQTVPTSINVHMIEDHQLDTLANVSKPLPLAVAGVAAGAVLGLLPSLLAAVCAIGTAGFGVEQALYVGLEPILLFVAVYFGISAYRGDQRARQLVDQIRSRTRQPL